MASLLERLNVPGSVGPVRNKSQRSGGAPYNRSTRPPKGNSDATWEHDLYGKDPAAGGRLEARLSNTTVIPKMNLSMADRALREANGEKGFSIKGASSRGNVVQVGGLAKGTTGDDVEAIFKRCGPITRSEVMRNGDPVVVRLTFKHEKDAQAAVAKFHGQPADGKTLEVKVVGGVNTSFGGRIGVATIDNSVDVLMESDSNNTNGSKLRSDAILAQDARATVLIAPPGTNPVEYMQQPQRGRGRGRGRGGRGRGRGTARMEVD